MDLATPTPDPDEEWELRNDDGFIYKRRKKDVVNDSTATTEVPPTLPPPDPAAEERFRRRRKKKTLLTIKSRYQKELSLWEHLSNTCDAMREKARNLERERGGEEDGDTEMALVESSTGEDRDLGPLIDRLLTQVELQEAIMQKISNLCDDAEALCSAQEDEFKESLISLPIWASPRELMAALSEE